MPHNQANLDRLRAFVVAERMRQGMSQRQLAARGRISSGSYSSFESSKDYFPRRPLLEGIARGLGVPYETLDRVSRGLPPDPTTIEQADAVVQRILSLSPENRETLNRVIDGLLSSQLHQEP